MIKVFVIKPLSESPTDGVDNVNLEVWKRIGPDKITFYASSEKKLIKRILAMQKLRPDFIWGMGRITDLPFLFFKNKKTKYLINWHAVLFKKQDAPWKVKTPWFIRKFIFNKSDKIIAVSQFTADKIKSYFPNLSVIGILNGIDTDFFKPDRADKNYLKQKYNINFSKPIILFVGALVSRKRPEIFIDLSRKYNQANFVLIGRNADSYDIRGVKWIEMMPREDVAILMASSDLFVFPSLNEPCAAVIQEAMASGLPVILSNHGGNKEFIAHNKEGFLVDVEKDNFLEYIKLALENKKLSKIAREKAVREFQWQDVAKKYEDYICSS